MQYMIPIHSIIDDFFFHWKNLMKNFYFQHTKINDIFFYGSIYGMLMLTVLFFHYLIAYFVAVVISYFIALLVLMMLCFFFNYQTCWIIIIIIFACHQVFFNSLSLSHTLTLLLLLMDIIIHTQSIKYDLSPCFFCFNFKRDLMRTMIIIIIRSLSL